MNQSYPHLLPNPLTLDRMAINQATTRLGWSHETSLEGYAKQGIKRVALWRDKVAETGVSATRALLDDLNMTVTGLNRIGPVFTEDGALDPRFLEDAKRGIDEAALLRADTLMFFPGTSLPGKKDLEFARAVVKDCLLQVLPIAHQAGVRLVLEPLHPMVAGDRSCLNTMKQCNDLCDEAPEDLGIVVDVYHVWWDAELRSEIVRAGAKRLAGFHISDWLVPTRDLLCDRGMIGDGVIELRKVRGWMEDAGYDGAIEIEIFSDHWWRQNPEFTIRTAITRALELA